MKTKLILFALLISISTIAQNSINYKALIKDDNGNIIASSSIDIQFIIYEGVALTNNVYQESHTINTNGDGFVIVNIGEGTTADVFNNIGWENDEHYLNVQVNIGSGLLDLGTSKFMTVPYALIAGNVTNKIDDLIDGKSDNDGSNDGSSIFLGTNAGVNDDGTNNRSIGIGWEALTSNTTGRDNMAIGNNTLTANINGVANVGIGTETLFNNNGSYNIGIGYHTLFSNTSGSDNIAIGYESLDGNTTGVNNNAIGTHALRENTTGFFNNAVGRHALQNNTTGAGNTAVGHGSLRDNLIGSNNAAFGNGAGDNVNGDNNVFIGYNSGIGLANSTNSGNIVIGSNVGSGADYNNRLYIDNFNTSNPLLYGEFDTNLLRVNGVFDINNAYQFPTTDGASNQVLQTDGSGVLTWQNLNESSGLEAIDEGNGIGYRIKGKNSINYGNIGSNAVDFSDSSGDNIYEGATGSNSFAIGDDVLASGYCSLSRGQNVRSTGLYGTTVGFFNTNNGNYATAMGIDLNVDSYGSLAIGRYNVGGGSNSSWVSSDPIFEIGNGTFSTPDNIMTVLKNGNVGIGTHNPQSSLHVDGELRLGPIGGGTLSFGGGANMQVSVNFVPEFDNNRTLGNTSKRWNTVFAVNGTINTSDRREKKNIKTLDYGLDEVLKMQPVSFNWKNKKNPDTKLGLIAQELQTLVPEVVKSHTWETDDITGQLTKKELERLGVYYSDLVPVLIKAIQEQQDIINSQNSKIDAIEMKLNALLEQNKKTNNKSF